MLNGLDLFSGIGGISLALKPWVRTVAYCEQDRYAQAVLLSRMRDGLLDRAPIWPDVRTLRGDMLPKIDAIFGGFPCQDISAAGLGKGLDGERSGLFFEIIRLVEEIRPAYVFLENVPAIRTRGLGRVLRELSILRYDCRWTVVSAAEVGAPHLRKRWFIVAYSRGERRQQIAGSSYGDERTDEGRREKEMHVSQRDGEGSREGFLADAPGIGWSAWGPESAGIERRSVAPCGGEAMADADRERREKYRGGALKYDSEKSWGIGDCWSGDWWKTEPAVGRVVDGLAARVDRIRCLGNSVVPLAAREAFKRLVGLSG